MPGRERSLMQYIITLSNNALHRAFRFVRDFCTFTQQAALSGAESSPLLLR
jgi:hypothetical protein